MANGRVILARAALSKGADLPLYGLVSAARMNVMGGQDPREGTE
jgi:hypothetical protein